MRRTLATLSIALAVAGHLASAQTPGSRASPAGAAEGVNVVDVGARGDGQTDSTAAIQAAIDRVQANATRGRVFLPAGRACYIVSSPLAIRYSGVRLEGESYGAYGTGTCLRAADGFVGPLLYLSSEQRDLPWARSLVAGAGQALSTNAVSWTGQTYLDFQDAGAAAEIGGIRSFTLELFVRLDESVTPDTPNVFVSAGHLGGKDPQRSAFALKIASGNHPSAYLVVDGKTVQVSSNTFTVAVAKVYHMALTYDGAAVRLFVGEPGTRSTLVASAPAAGAITQSPFEEMVVPGMRSPWPHGTPLQAPVTGAIDSIRISDTARYTDAYTVPTVKLAFDARTRMLENFDRETADWSVVRTSHGTAYLPKYPPFAGGLLNHIDISRLELRTNGQGIWAHGVILSAFHDLSFYGGIYGFNAHDDVFLNAFDRIRLVADDSSKAGLVLYGGGGYTSYRDINNDNWPIGLIAWGQDGNVDSWFSHGKHLIPIVLREGAFNLRGVNISNEDSGPSFVANVRLINNSNVHIDGGVFERFAGSGPSIQVDGGNAVVMTAPLFHMGRDAKEVIEVLASPTNKILILNGVVTPPTSWSTSASDIVTVP